MNTTPAPATILGFDHGAHAIGVAVARAGTIAAVPLATLDNNDQLEGTLRELLEQQRPSLLVVGWPRGLDGQTTAQTQAAEQFASWLKRFAVPVELQDEAVTSQLAADMVPAKLPLARRKQLEHQYAAKIIVEDYLAAQR